MIKVATTLSHPVGPTGTEKVCEYLNVDSDKFFSWDNIFKDLYDEFRMHNDEIMKATTLCGYSYKEKYIECFFPVKIKDFNIIQFEQWKRDINKSGISLRYKNDIINFLDQFLILVLNGMALTLIIFIIK